ncbi:MAG: hypothetical protein AAF183_13070 [Pseudomonadota bacterium]
MSETNANSPVSGEAQTGHKAVAGGFVAGLAPFAQDIIGSALLGQVPAITTIDGLLTYVAMSAVSAAVGAYAVWHARNYSKG